MIVKETTQKPPVTKIYLQDFCSNKPLIAVIGKTNNTPVIQP